MKTKLIGIGNKMPTWVTMAYQEYVKRLPPQYAIELIEIPLKTRNKNTDSHRLIEQEGDAMLKAIAPQDYVIALDIPGKRWSTEQLAAKFNDWQQLGTNITILIGGPEGLAPSCKQRADESWSLSLLTFPHPLVRVILAEQLYRAWSILQNHPYHK